MGCGCGGGSRANKIQYQVRFKDGHTETFATTDLAQQAIRAAKGGVAIVSGTLAECSWWMP